MRNAEFGMDKEYGISPYQYESNKDAIPDVYSNSWENSIPHELLIFAGKRPFTPDYFPNDVFPDRGIFDDIPAEARERHLNVFFSSNGDVLTAPPSHPEIAIAECSSIFDVAARDKASELYLWALARRWFIELPDVKKRDVLPNQEDSIELYKNDATHNGETFGTHESYTAPSDKKTMERIEKYFPTALVVRQALFGAGHLRSLANLPSSLPPEQIRELYSYSQRASHITHSSYLGRSSNKALYSIRETKPPREDKKRVHVSCGDSNMSAYATALKFGVTHLMLQLIQETDYELPCTREPVKQVVRVADDPFTPIECTDGKFRTAFDILGEYCDISKKMYGNDDFETDWTMEEWNLMINLVYNLGNLERFDYKKFSPFIGRHDALSKLSMLHEFMESEGWEAITPERYTHLQSIDNAYHLLDPYRGLTYSVKGDDDFDEKSCPFDSRYISPLKLQEIVDAMFMPPFDTRAVFRGAAISKWNNETLIFGNRINMDSGYSHATRVTPDRKQFTRINFGEFCVPEGNRALYESLLSADFDEFLYWANNKNPPQ